MITTNKLSFGYSAGKRVLNDISLTLVRGIFTVFWAVTVLVKLRF